MQVFATLKLLMGLLEPILAPLRPIWSQKELQNSPKNNPKSIQKLVQNMTPKMSKKSTSFGPQTGPENPSNRRGRAPGISGRGVLKSSWSQEGPKMAQDGPEEPKIAPSWPQKAPKIAPRWDKLG